MFPLFGSKWQEWNFLPVFEKVVKFRFQVFGLRLHYLLGGTK